MIDRTSGLIEAFPVIEHDRRQMRPQSLVVVIRQQREQAVGALVAFEHQLLFLRSAAGYESQSGHAFVVRVRLPNRRFVILFLGVGHAVYSSARLRRPSRTPGSVESRARRRQRSACSQRKK
jgi:hypothetical protein